ncbi:MAG: lamin tail domain-containing protein, partial [Verrucomicrobiales bacterium]|nr:lamin tail domain-containing protein [Verrucomicrobiales bacterium]
MNLRRACPLIFASVVFCVSANARVVINEISYHPPNDAEALEYVELHNASDQPVDLSGWKFSKGIKLQFPAGTKLEPRGYVVVGRNRDRLKEVFGVDVAGVFEQALKNGGERIELTNAKGENVDSVRFNNKAPWPVAPDGYSSSLERITPLAPSTIPQNWAASVLPDGTARPTGTPGKENSRYSGNLPPVILNVKFTPANPKPEQSIAVEADVEDGDGLKEVKLLFRTAGPG